MYGRAGELERLNRDRNNPLLPRIVRRRADEAHAKIVKQMKDKKLMRMRRQLINAAQAGDTVETTRIQVAMKAYLKEDQEVGS